MHKVLLLLPLVAIMFELGLSTTEHGIVALMKNKGLTARAVLVSAFLVPAIAVVFIELMGLHPRAGDGPVLGIGGRRATGRSHGHRRRER